MAKTIARWIALAALFLIPLTPLIVADSYFFPFITGKAFYFRILVEILVAAWAGLAFLDKAYRPRFSWIGGIVVLFIAWMFLADCFAVNAAKAFWSNFERMEGWVLLIHLLGFFLAAGAVLRVEKKWRAWFLTSLAVSLVLAGYALLQLGGTLAIHQGSSRIDATIGNSAYLAIYFLFNTFIALWLALSERRAWLKWLLVALAALEGVLIFYTETRGTVLGLACGLALAALLTLLTAGKRARYLAAWGLTVIVVAAGGLYLARDAAFVQGNHVLNRVTSISLADGSTRFTLWHMAFEGAMERPIVGWGQEGFNYVFNKYYDPSLYTQEQWFDRAHNAFIDWLIAGGFPAFLLYIALFGVAIAMLWRSSELARSERILLTSALVGYAVHNLFVFDNLYAYVYFFAILSLIDSQVGRPFVALERAPEASESDGITYVLPIGAIAIALLIGTVNVPGMRVAGGLIDAMRASENGVNENTAAFKDLAAHPSFAGQEVREQIISFAAAVIESEQVATPDKQAAAELAVTEMQKQITEHPLDAREHLQLSYILHIVGDLPDALKEIEAAIALSPKKEQFFIEKASLEWDMNDPKAAQADFNAAYALGPQFSDLAAYAAAGDIAARDTGSAATILNKVFGTTVVDSDALASAYYRIGDWQDLITIWKMRARAATDAQPWFGLAAAYYSSGDKNAAIQALMTSIQLFPDASTTANAMIAQVKKGS